ncbi:MAG: FeoB-associated Cys-rich membrane protein [Bacteroidota bacterium]
MIQEVIVYIIIFLSLVYIGYQFISFLKNSSKNGCSCSGCDLNSDITHIKALIRNK